MRTRFIFAPLRFIFFALFFIIAGLVFTLIYFSLIGVVFNRIGFNFMHATILLFATLVGSFINIPIKTVKAKNPIVIEKSRPVFTMPYRVPELNFTQTKTVIAANVGGAIIPTFISVYLLSRIPSQFVYALFGVVIVSAITHSIARPVRGLGITVPAFIPPIAAAICAILMGISFGLPQSSVFVIAYVSGVLGTLIGADLTNLKTIPRLGTGVASIGGAGTFDGVFLSGILAVIIS